MTKANEKSAKRGRSARCFTDNVLDADAKARKTSYVKGEKPRVEVQAEKKQGTTMTKGKRLDSLEMLQSLMKHSYGVVFNDIETIRDCRPESFKKLKKPIDLETVMSTLENNSYFTVEAFAEDVRTTFANAMQIFPATDDVHKMAIKLSENFEMGFKIKVESPNREPKTSNDKELSEKKKTREKTDLSIRKRKLTAASSDREKIYVVQQESDRKGNRVSVTGTHLVKGKDGKCFDVTVVSSAPKNSLGKLESSVPMSPRRAARIAALMDRFSGTIKKADKALSASATTDGDRKTEAGLKVKEHSKREREGELKMKEQSGRERKDQLKEQRKREREALERMKNTANFSADHEALKEFERLLGHPELTMTDNSRRSAESIGEEVNVEEMEEGEIPPSPTCVRSRYLIENG